MKNTKRNQGVHGLIMREHDNIMCVCFVFSSFVWQYVFFLEVGSDSEVVNSNVMTSLPEADLESALEVTVSGSTMVCLNAI